MAATLVTTQGDNLASEILAAELDMLLTTRPFMRGVCVFRGNTRGVGSDTIKVPQIVDDDVAASVAEDTAIASDTIITDASYSLTPGRLAIKRTVSDLMQGIASLNVYSALGLAQFNFNAIMRGFDGLVTAAFPSLSGTTSGSGAAFSYTQFLEGLNTLDERGYQGQRIWIGHPEQHTDLRTDLRNEVGPMQLVPATAEQMNAMGGEFKGILNNVQIWTSSQVTQNAGDHRGGMFAYGAIAYGEGSPDPVQLGATVVPAGTAVYSVFDVDGDKANQEMWTNYFVGISVTKDARGIMTPSIDD